MKAVNILLLCVLGAALLSSVLCNSGNNPVDCCFNFFKNQMNKSLFSSYYKTDRRCSLSGIVLITKKGRSICVDGKQPWVKTITDFLEKKSR
ncbi:PREDICTED: eotaxin-like isoform X4 [Poecilia mexicana]|uniref:Chemokine interleukin-8-like domain-containing protein n=1 Tax=Poecilia mexicana TaxID=48701 RepID=A0A3B3Z5T6_9TELE|nr:PREDICTED: eotaxin-like isoform X4 [Poecilia formosa]XP_014865495.1 PREDICTED: eotaxin-like isoform X4 [Poecilia mexicana]